jgi:hypothetical protein
LRIAVGNILNENAPLLSPDQAMLTIFEVLQKRRDGELRYIHNYVVIYISESHVVDGGDGTLMYNMATVYSEAGNAIPFATAFAEDFNRRWATFKGADYLESSDCWDHFKARDPINPFNVIRCVFKEESQA